MRYLLTVIFITMGMSFTDTDSTSQSLDQGISGKVVWLEGNVMPGPGRIKGEGQPAVREVRIYELTHLNKTQQQGTFFTDVSTTRVATVNSNERGIFQIYLPPGKYSLFTVENDGLFANGFDRNGFINPVEVKEGQVTEVTITINYKAAY